jgi:sugar/nucleoside kinase (ribokinase family)
MDLVCLGELLIDMFPAEIGRRLVEVSAFLPKPGGAPANVAVAAARLGKQSSFIGKVGNDAFGHHLVDTLAKEGVGTRGMRVDADARTTMAFIAMPDKHTAEFVFYRNPGADMMLQVEELDQELLQNTKGFHFGSISLIAEPSRSATKAAVDMARAEGALISFDVNYRPSLWTNSDKATRLIKEMIPFANVLKVNETELEILSGSDDLAAGSQDLFELGPDLIVITLGADGSCFRSAGGFDCVPPFRVQTVDSVGCGDAFTAGLLSRLVSTDTWHEQLEKELLRLHLRYANAVGALTARKKGVIPALPSAWEVEVFLQTTN